MARDFAKASNQAIQVAGLPDFTTQISISIWFRIASIVGGGQFYALFAKTVALSSFPPDDRNIGLDYRIRSGVHGIQLTWTQPAGTLVEIFFVKDFDVGVWNHLLVTVDWTTNPDSVHMYLNGVDQTISVTGSNNSTPTTTSPQTAFIGATYSNTDQAFDGGLAELAIWDGIILTAAEALALSKRYAPIDVHPGSLTTYISLIRELIDYKGLVTLTDSGTTAGDHPPVIYAG